MKTVTYKTFTDNIHRLYFLLDEDEHRAFADNYWSTFRKVLQDTKLDLQTIEEGYKQLRNEIKASHSLTADKRAELIRRARVVKHFWIVRMTNDYFGEEE